MVLLSEQLSLQDLTITVRDITATLMLRVHITVTAAIPTIMVIMVAVPTIMVVHTTITSEPTDIGQSSKRAHRTITKGPPWCTSRPAALAYTTLDFLLVG